MKRRELESGELGLAMQEFVNTLPDPIRSHESTIRNEVMLNEKKVTFLAQKSKGPQGMCWNINCKS